MKLLVINAGSSSVKFSLYAAEQMHSLASGLIERIGLTGTVVHYRTQQGIKFTRDAAVRNIRDGVALISDLLTAPEFGILESDGEISAVGHRVVHGGESMGAPTLIDDHVRGVIRACFDLAPLHNPPNLEGIDACLARFAGVPQVAVFDTAFHNTLPEYAYLYALPYALYETDKIRRYGFHGTSHRYVSRRAAEYLEQPLEELRMVTCHLGNGSSMAAIAGGQSIDTTMGFTPLEGLPMGTRSGDIDPAIHLYLMRQKGLSADEVDTLLNRESGLLGLGAIGSSDMRDLEAALAQENPGARRAVEVFTYRIKKYIGAYAFAMGGLDAIVFTAGIGENAPFIREGVCQGLEGHGIVIDGARNRGPGKGIRQIQHRDSRVGILVIPTDEEQEIAQQTLTIVTQTQGQPTTSA